MTIQDFIDILMAIRDNKEVHIPYQLLKYGELNIIVDNLGSNGVVDYFKKVSEAEPATFINLKEGKIER